MILILCSRTLSAYLCCFYLSLPIYLIHSTYSYNKGFIMQLGVHFLFSTYYKYFTKKVFLDLIVELNGEVLVDRIP